MMSEFSGFLDPGTLTGRQKAILEGKVKDLSDEEIEWYEKHGSDVVFDSEKAVTKEKPVFVPPTHAAITHTKMRLED